MEKAKVDVNRNNMSSDYIDLQDLFQQYLKRWWMILIGFVVGTLLAGVYTFKLATPIYEASSMVYMRGSGEVVSLQDLQIGAALTKDYEVIFTSRPILEEVIDQLDLEMTWKQLKGRVELTNQDDTRILRVAIKDADPKLASEIVNKLVEIGMESVKEIDSKEPYLIEKAVVDWDKVSPSHRKNLMMGAMLGILLVVGVITLNYLMNDTIRSVKDVEQVLRLPVFCIVPESSSCSYKNLPQKKNVEW
ncbi:MAG: Wzz/FepE/Etk N-terminal domain-containing protein [Eubacteriales bacterium]|nr:Wzz/FepE/Etk N-terminal domain-containing protein [Eubacteriales bacterium]